MRPFSTLLFTLFFSAPLIAQADFDHYSTLQSKGTVPLDFSEQTFEKIEEGMTERRNEIGSQLEQREFLEKTGYAIDELLHSGLVVYGDDISNYVSSIADKLLAGNPDLRSKLRFYTLKLNATNAFSTDQGIIFVTTGLMSQLSSEAQLAFILAHEISHYTEKHVVETFTWKKNNRYGNRWVDRMSVYSKDKEFSADNLAVDIYREAGYSKDEILSAFDVLLYSYLPFDEVAIDLDYFASEQLFLPDFLFPSKIYEIKADPDEDDSESSHPNINKRKKAVEQRMSEITGEWGATINSVGDKQFFEFRNIARFETVRTDVMQANYGEALYSIYLLEQEFPSSTFLQRMKMHTWLGLYQYESNSRVNNTILSGKQLEGESAPVHYFVRKLKRASLTTIALRNIYDVHKRYPEDIEMNAIYSFSLKLFAKDEKFDLEDYSTMTFSQYGDSVEAKQQMILNDTIVKNDSVAPPPKLEMSKYDRIKKNNSSDAISESVDSLKYYYYGLSDLILDKNFIIEFMGYANKKVVYLPPLEESSRKGKKACQRRAYDAIKIGSDNLIVVEPRVIDYGKNGVNLVKSEKLEGMFTEAIVNAADLTNTQIHTVDKRSLTTQSYNVRSILFGFLSQLVQDDDVMPFPIDYIQLKDISTQYGTSDVMFTMVDHTFRPDINPWNIVASAFLLPTLPFTLALWVPFKIIAGNQTNLTVLIMNLDSGELIAGDVFNFHEHVSKHSI
ncbi:MAG: hypothetical protein COA38_12015, partial [Fluviicola sp.]